MPVADLRRFLATLCAASAPRSSSLVAFAGALGAGDGLMASPKVAIKARVLVDLKEMRDGCLGRD